MNKLSINNQTELLQNKHYNKFTKEKEKLKSQYDERLWQQPAGNISNVTKEWFLKEGQHEWREYLSKIGDIIFRPESDFQKFVWDILSERDKEVMEFKSRARLK